MSSKSIPKSDLNKVVNNLNKKLNDIPNKTLSGFLRSAALILEDTEKTIPKTPVDTGNMRASRFVVYSGQDKSGIEMGKTTPAFHGRKDEILDILREEHPTVVQEALREADKMKGVNVMIGYTAYYAFGVHEAIGQNFKREGAGSMWLEQSLKRNTDKIVKLVTKEAKRAL
jgi:hypothetical protein